MATATAPTVEQLSDGATPTDALARYKAEMQAIMSAGTGDDGVVKLADDARAKFDALVSLANAEIAQINQTHDAEVQKSRDLERFKSVALLPDVDPKREAFEVNTSTMNKAAEFDLLREIAKGRTMASAPDLGAQFVESDEYKAATRTGEVSKGASIGVNTGVLMKTLLTSPTRGSSASVSSNVSTIHRLMDAITVLPVGRDTIVSHRYTYGTNAAAETAEGAAKPESALTVTTATLTPKKVAHSLPMTAESLADHPRMRAVVNSIMVNGLLTKVEALIATDLAAWSGLATQAFTTDMTTSLLAGKVAAMEYGVPNGILIGNTDYQTLALAGAAADNNYPGPYGPANFSVWGLPVFPSSSLTSGFAYVGDLTQIAWNERTPVILAVGWVNTQFTENEVTLLCETRGMLDVMHNLQVVKTDIVTP